MFQESEIINVIFGLIGVLIFYWNLKHIHFPGSYFMVISFILQIFAYVFTVLEGFIWYDIFNFLEHACYALSGVLFAIGGGVLFNASHKAMLLLKLNKL